MKNLRFNFIGVYADGSLSPADQAMQAKIAKQGSDQKIVGTSLNSAAGAASAFGPIGAIVGAGIELVNGIYQGVEGGLQKKRAASIAAPETDPTQVGMLDTLKRLRLGYQTGAEASSYKGILNQGLNTTIKGIGAYSGGATGNMIGAISNAQDNEANAYNTVAATLEKNRIGVLGMEDKDTNDIAQRKLDIQQSHYLQAQSDAYGNTKAGKQDILGGLSNIALTAFDKMKFNPGDDEDSTPASQGGGFTGASSGGGGGGAGDGVSTAGAGGGV